MIRRAVDLDGRDGVRHGWPGVGTALWLALAVLVLAAALAMAWLRFTPQPPVADDRHYVTMAWNLTVHGIPSLEPPQAGGDRPAATMFREPGYPLLLAGLMRLVPAVQQAAFCDAPPSAGCERALRLAQFLNLLLILAAACLTALAVRAMGGTRPAALLALAILALSTKVLAYAEFLISESLALFLAAAAASLLLPAAGSGANSGAGTRAAAWWPFLAALATGLACGALAATKQVFLPLVVPAALALALAAAVSPSAAGGFAGRLLTRGLPRAALLALGWACIVGPWLFWNMATFGSALPSDRAREGEVLAYRIELLEMNRSEYALSWVWWTGNFGAGWVRDLVPERHWVRFQDSRPEGFTPSSNRRWSGDVAARQAQGLTPAEAYAAVATDYRHRLLEAWPRNLMTSLPVLNRGLWVDNFALVTVPCLLVLLVFARRWRLAGFYLFAVPGLTGLVVQAGLSNNIPRWNLPLAPVLAAAGALTLWRLACWLRARRLHRRKVSA